MTICPVVPDTVGPLATIKSVHAFAVSVGTFHVVPVHTASAFAYPVAESVHSFVSGTSAWQLIAGVAMVFGVMVTIAARMFVPPDTIVDPRLMVSAAKGHCPFTVTAIASSRGIALRILRSL
eukprot:TRINITY_DN62990_c0_g1_i1.p3 TRINITY_DN62990_c0_g1~~TRINITY_DN62990_c0_g1_i1.p3  ORF type:complete len:122 (-),score=6.19 TRINITY_DN62990_c0_g1_i1:58-423(-)